MGALFDNSIGLLERLGDPSLALDGPSRTYVVLGAVVQAMPEADRQALFELLLDRKYSLNNLAKCTFLLGFAAERSGMIPQHELGQQQGEGWGLLGHLFDPSLGIETSTRALLLLGAITEHNGYAPEQVLQILQDQDWAMGNADKAVLLLVAAALQPKLAIDAGTFLGGSASALSMFAERVITIDIDPARAQNVEHLPNVDFLSGIASDVLAELLPTTPAAELVVLDASHTCNGIQAEVEQLLSNPPSCLRAVLIHDSAMETCRAGLDLIDWAAYPLVRSFTLDFLPGVENEEGVMGGGLAVVWLLE